MSKKRRSDRTFHDGESRRYFDFHLKPNNNTAPDKCVKIYCDWDKEAQCVRIGWIGRHSE